MDSIQVLSNAIQAMDSWRIGREGDDGRLIEYRRTAREDQLRNQVWQLAEITLELPQDATKPDRVALVDSLLRSDIGLLRSRLLGWVADTNSLRTLAVELEGDARMKAEQSIARQDNAISSGLGEYRTTLNHLKSIGSQTAELEAELNSVLTVRAEILSARMELAAAEIKDVQERLDRGVTGLELEVRNLELRVAATANSLTKVLDIMDSQELDTNAYRRHLLVSTGELSAKTLNVGVFKQLTQGWWLQAKEWTMENGMNLVFKFLVFLIILGLANLVAGIVHRMLVHGLGASPVQMSSLLRDMLMVWTKRLIQFVGLMIGLSHLGLEIGPLLAGLGVAGFVIGFAVQDSLSNFAAGMMILFYRPFDVGDVVEAGGVLGKVTEMSLVSTTFLSFDNQRYIVPNRKLWGDVIKNSTAMDLRRVDLVFGIGYGDDIPKAEQVITEVLTEHPKVLKDPEPVVKLSKLNDSSVDFIARPWCKTEDYWDVYWEITRTIKLRFDAEGISIPFPQRDVHLFQKTQAP